MADAYSTTYYSGQKVWTINLQVAPGKGPNRRIVDILSDLNELLWQDRELVDQAYFDQYSHWSYSEHSDRWRDAPKCDYGFRSWESERDPERLWPDRFRWISVYPVTGGSEGHYIHIDVIGDHVMHDSIRGRFYALMTPPASEWGWGESYLLHGLPERGDPKRHDAAMKRLDNLTGHFEEFATRKPIALAKTFEGWDYAARLAGAAARLLGA